VSKGAKCVKQITSRSDAFHQALDIVCKRIANKISVSLALLVVSLLGLLNKIFPVFPPDIKLMLLRF